MNALNRMDHFLDQHLIPFDIVAHPHTQTSAETARAAGLTPDRLAKGVLLDGVGCQMVALIPADQEVHLGKLGLDQGLEFSLAEEASVSRLFSECEPGVVPGLPNAWGVEMVWDDDLLASRISTWKPATLSTCCTSKPAICARYSATPRTATSASRACSMPEGFRE